MSRKIPLITSLLLTIAFSIVGLAVVGNAFFKSRNEISHLQHLIPTNTQVHVNDENILDTGRVSIAIHAVLLVLSLAALLKVSVARFSSSKGSLPLALAIGFCSVWLLATTIAFTVIFASKSAKVSATQNGITVPQSIVSSLASALGLSPQYKKHGYLRAAAILPWFTFLFASVSSVLLLTHSSTSKKGGLARADAEKDESPTNS
jgi:hypothetical protein